MKRQIVNYKNISENRAVIKYIDNKYCLINMKTNKQISHDYDYISEFNYNEDAKTLVALVKICVGQGIRKKDTLIGYMDIEGSLAPFIYSVHFDKLFNIENKNIDELIKMIQNKLLYESNIEEKKENEAINKIKLLFKKNME